MYTQDWGLTAGASVPPAWVAGWAWFGNLPGPSRFLVGSGYKEEGLGAWAEAEEGRQADQLLITLRASRLVSELGAGCCGGASWAFSISHRWAPLPDSPLEFALSRICEIGSGCPRPPPQPPNLQPPVTVSKVACGSLQAFWNQRWRKWADFSPLFRKAEGRFAGGQSEQMTA